MSTLHLKGPGLNNFFAESMVKDKGPLQALQKSAGPMREAVRDIIERMLDEVVSSTPGEGTLERQRLIAECIEVLRHERRAFLWALTQFMDGMKRHEVAEETGIPPEDAEVLFQWWLEYKKEGLKLPVIPVYGK